MQYIERRIGDFLHERRINNILNQIESLSYPGVDVSSSWRDNERKSFRRDYRNVATLYSNGDPQIQLQVIECFRDLFLDLKEKGLVTVAKKFSPVELLTLSPNSPISAIEEKPKLKRLLDEMMAIKRSGRSFEVSDLFIHSADLSPGHLGLAADLSPGHLGLDGSRYDTLSQLFGESLEPENVPQNLIEIGKTHVHEDRDVTTIEDIEYQQQHRQADAYVPLLRTYEYTHLRDTIYGRIVPKNYPSQAPNPQA